MAKKPEEYFPKKKVIKKSLIQAAVDAELAEQVRAVLEAKNWTMRELVTGLLLRFLDEQKARRK